MNKNSAIYKYRNEKPTIVLVESAPSRDVKRLEKVEYEWIHEYSIEYRIDC